MYLSVYVCVYVTVCACAPLLLCLCVCVCVCVCLWQHLCTVVVYIVIPYKAFGVVIISQDGYCLWKT